MNQLHPTQLASEEDVGDVGCNGRCGEWEIDPTLLRPEHRLDRFGGERLLTDTGADAVVRLDQLRRVSHEPGRMVKTGTDASAQADIRVGVNDWMARQGLCERLDRLGPASAVMGFLFAVATVRKGLVQGLAAGASAMW